MAQIALFFSGGRKDRNQGAPLPDPPGRASPTLPDEGPTIDALLKPPGCATAGMEPETWA